MFDCVPDCHSSDELGRAVAKRTGGRAAQILNANLGENQKIREKVKIHKKQKILERNKNNENPCVLGCRFQKIGKKQLIYIYIFHCFVLRKNNT